MDIGKFFPPVAKSFLGDVNAALQELYLGFSGVSAEMAALPGFATLTCSAAITKGMAVNVNAGQLRPADAGLLRPAIGIALQTAASGTKCRIIIGSGLASGLTGLTANSSVYLGNGGALVYVKPGAGMIQGLGFTLSTTDLFVTISQP